jgi:hypothetical protein
MRFVPVEIVPSASSRSAAAGTVDIVVAGENPSSTTTAAASAARVEALLPGGVRLLVPCDEPAAIRAVVAALVEGRREDPPC